jgi:AraC-like DNA-binding protein
VYKPGLNHLPVNESLLWRRLERNEHLPQPVLHMSKDTVNKYVTEYEKQKSELLLMNPEADPEELIQAIVEKPKYNSDNRKPKRVTPGIIKAIEECLEINEWRRANGMSKQQMKKSISMNI